MGIRGVPIGTWMVQASTHLPDGAVAQHVWVNGHGPVAPEKQSILFTSYRDGYADVCLVPECMKCIRNYVREVKYPRGKAEEEVFV